MASYSPFSFGAGGGAYSSGGGGAGFTMNPTPQQGSGPFGSVPGAVGPITASTVAQPPNPFTTLSGVVPGLSGLNSGASSFINSELGGQLSPGTINALTNLSAERGIGSGMGPASGLWSNALLGNVAGATEALQQHGVGDFNSFLPTVAQTETITPQEQIQINSQNAGLSQQAALANQQMAQWNATMAAAPNPAAAQSYAQQLFDRYMNPASSTGISRGPWTPPQAPTPRSLSPINYGPAGTPFGAASDMTQGGYGPAYANPGASYATGGGGASSTSPQDWYPAPLALEPCPTCTREPGQRIFLPEAKCIPAPTWPERRVWIRFWGLLITDTEEDNLCRER